jgi:hypothetical protein
MPAVLGLGILEDFSVEPAAANRNPQGADEYAVRLLRANEVKDNRK